MKLLTVFRGQSKVNHKCTNGDVYDSSATLEKPAQFGPVDIWHSELVNTDSTIGYKGGKLAKGNYNGIVGYSAKGKRVIKIFIAPDLSKIKNYGDLTAEMMTLPSEIPNPNHSNMHIVQYVYVHEGYRTSDGSHACLTIYRYPLGTATVSDCDKLMELLEDNETINIKLT
jgi:hypothetical protein